MHSNDFFVSAIVNREYFYSETFISLTCCHSKQIIWNNSLQDEFYNAKMKKGTIFHRIRNMPPKKNSEEPIANEAELIDFLKQCVVAKDKLKLKSMLKETITLRIKLLRENKEEFADFMAFYFADPELVRVFD